MSKPGRTEHAPPRRAWVAELRRKAIHLSFLLLPLELLNQWLPWPRDVRSWRLGLAAAVVVTIALDLLRIHEHRARAWFRRFFGELIREHEQFNLLGSTYLVLGALLALEMFPRPVAAAALGFTVLGDAFAALAGRAFGGTRFFGKSLEGYAGGLAACLAWAAYLAVGAHLPWPVVVSGALVASLVELLPIPLDDNLAITLFSGYTMKLLLGGS